jgi:tetratricopeptide (TPR) repeat protein
MLSWLFKSAGKRTAPAERPGGQDRSIDVALRHHQAGRLREAEAGYLRALAAEPDNVDALHFLGVVAYQEGKHARAAELITRALSLNQSNAPAHNNLGNVFRELGRTQDAIACYRRAISLTPGYADAYANLGAVLRACDALDEAVSCYRRLLSFLPGDAAAHFGLGNALHDLGKLDEAVDCYDKALAYKPDFPDVHVNLAAALMSSGRLSDAEEHYRQALRLRPAYAPATFGYALLKLLQGDYAGGLPLFESRFEALSGPLYAGLRAQLARFAGKPRWQGEAGGGRSLLLWTDQGLGDTLMVLRYIGSVRSRGFGRLAVHCDEALVRIVRALPGIDGVTPLEQEFPPDDFDCHSPMMSLPLVFHTTADTVPDDVPYIVVPDAIRQEWRRRLAAGTRPKVGVVWAGRKQFSRDSLRSVEFERLSPLLGIPDVDFVSLQKGKEQARTRGADRGVLDYMDHCRDLMDTAGLITQLDLVISVDTSVAHLAGALGKPVWLLNRFESEWRWMLEREDSPWYPTMKIFRQTRRGDWDAVIARVVSALAERYGARTLHS